ncbi:unnamed protein product, partial [Oppiella nova]
MDERQYYIECEREEMLNEYRSMRNDPNMDKYITKRVFFNMFDEANRLKSFDNWPHDFISIETLANAGFFYLEGDLVQCAFCRGIISNWQQGNEPYAEHLKHFPLCPFIMDEVVLNQPISEIHRGQDVCGNMIVPHANFYKELDNRINSYSTSVFTCEILTKTLAEAGDEPWEEHTKHMPYCPHVQRNKTQNYIRNVHLRLQETEQEDYQGYDVWPEDPDWDEPYHSSWPYVLMENSIVQEFLRLEFVSESILMKLLMDKYYKDGENFTSFAQLYDAFELYKRTNDDTKLSSEKPTINTTDEDNEETLTVETLLCKICYSKNIGVVFLDCGHQMACTLCASNLSDCPICRSSIKSY